MRQNHFCLYACYTLLVWLGVLHMSGVAFAAPAVGAKISNQAFVQYDNPLDPLNKLTSSSNVTIVEIAAALLTPDQPITAGPGSTVTWRHELSNNGSGADTYTLSVQNLGGDSGNLAGLHVVHDRNGNGVEDAGEAVPTVTLTPGTTAILLVIGQIPVNADEGFTYQTQINALSTVDPGIVLTRDDLATIAGPLIELGKTVSAPAAKQNDELVYTLSIRNRNAIAALPTQVSIDGLNLARVIVDDPVPANVQLKEAPVYPGPGKVVYHIAETPADQFVTLPPFGLYGQVDRIGVAYTAFAGNQTDELQFRTKVLDSAVDTTVVNQFRFRHRLGDIERVVISPEVQTVVSEPGKLPTLVNKDKQYADLELRIGLGDELFLEATCSACNTESGRRDYLVIKVTSGNNKLNDGTNPNRPDFYANTADGKDHVIVTAYETGPNTGIFRVVAFGEDTTKTVTIGIPTHQYTGGPIDVSDNLLETVRHDRLIATILYCIQPDLVHGKDVNVAANVLVDPFGVVFDSQTNLPVPGAQVTLVRMIGGAEAPDQTFIYDDNGRQCSPTPRHPEADSACQGSITTTADGKYRFPLVDAGDYFLKITPPATHTFPSNVSIPTSYNRVVVLGSRGEVFNVPPALGPVEIDVPVDPQLAQASLQVSKSGNRTTVELGEFVDYTVKVRNGGAAIATAVKVEDRMPSGFSYVQKSATLDSVAVEPVQGGGIIRFDLGNLPGNTEHTIRYRLKVGAVSRLGDAVNQVVAYEDTPGGLRSNVDAYKVRVMPGVFTAEGYITGKIYTDCNRNGVQDLEEIGVPGIRFYLEDGTFVVTDVEGKFDFYGLRPKTHILKLDRTTLPRDIELIEQNVRHGGDPASRFVDLKPAELHRADFAVTAGSGSCEGPGMEEIFQRRADGDAPFGELERNLKAELPVIPVTVSDVRSLPASGCLAGGDQKCGEHGKANLPELSEALTPAPRAKLRARMPELESYLPTADRNVAILNLTEGEILPTRQAVIQVKGTLGATMTLTVNDREVAFSRVGKRITVQDTRVEGREYIGVNLDPGANRIRFRQTDAMGNPRGEAVVTVVAPGALHAIKLLAPKKSLEADGESTMALNLILHDEDGVPVTSRTQITVEASAGRIQEKDLDPKQPGTQLFVEGGEAILTLVAPTAPGEGEVVVRTGTFKEMVEVKFVPAMRPLIAAGIVEGMISLKDFDTSKLTPAMASDGFEDELRSLSSSQDGQLNTSGRVAFFLKGKVKGEYLLTLSYDSDKNRNQSLFRDIRPEEYYPVYGDSAVKGYDAQSTGKLYARVDKGRSYVLYGDYNTRVENTKALELGQYSRSLTGVRAHAEDDKSSATVFVAQTNATQVVDEIPANGTSGPYPFRGVDSFLINSEKVEIILRDRNNPGVIISTQTQTRFVDYELEPLTNSLIFRSPVPSLDANLNPYFIRVTLEADQGGPEYWVGGVHGRHQFGERLTVGASAVVEDNPTQAYQLGSVNVIYKLTADTRVVLEGAASDTEKGNKGVGSAGRIEVVHEKGTDYWRLFHGQSENEFENPAAPLSAGRSESGARLRVSLKDWGLFRAEASRTESGITAGVRQGLKVSFERKVNSWLGLEVGSRIYDETTQPATGSSLGVTPYEGVTAWVKMNGQFPQLPGASAFLEFEQDVDHADRQVAAIGGDYRMGTQGRLYARHELISSLSGGNGLNDQQQRNTTVVGFEDEYMKDGRVFSEYRVRDAISANEAEAAIGLRNRWYLSEAVRMSTNLERVSTLKGNGNNDSTAASVGLEYLSNPLWKATGKVDFRWSDSTDTILNQLGLAWKLNRDWTLLARNTISLADNKKTGNKLLDRFQMGFAWRQVDTNRWDALTKIEYKLEDDRSVATQRIDRDAVIFSTHVNYHPVRRWTLGGNYAGKFVNDNSGAGAVDSTTHMVGARVIHDITERWEASVQGGQIWDDDGLSRHVLGVETGYMVMTNFWVSGGYNFVSYDDGDLVGNDYTVDGFYLRFRFKFDEDLFSARKPGINKTLEPENVSP